MPPVRVVSLLFLIVVGLVGILYHPLHTHHPSHDVLMMEQAKVGVVSVVDKYHEENALDVIQDTALARPGGAMRLARPGDYADTPSRLAATTAAPQRAVPTTGAPIAAVAKPSSSSASASSSSSSSSWWQSVTNPAATTGVRKQPQSPAEKCGHNGHGSTDGRACRCTVLFSGPDCEVGPETFVSQEFAVRWQGKNSVPDVDSKPRVVPASFDGPYMLNKQDVIRNQAEVMRIYLPGKQPPWRRVGKVDPPLMGLIPETDPANKRFRTCAIVGNSGSLIHLGSDLGREVDDAEMIMRFNAAPTKGLERFVGSRTTYRLVNSRWIDFREFEDEALLFNMRAASTVETYRARIAKNPKEKFYLFSQEMVNYMGQQAYQLSRSFKPHEAPGFELGDYTPTSGFTGVMLALQVCSNITVYGMMISEAHGMPYHYQNRCPQPYGERDEAEWLLFKRFAENGLLRFREPCVMECHDGGDSCDACRNDHPEVFSTAAMSVGRAIWSKMPMPDYCAVRAKVLAAEKQAKAQGKVGERGFTKEQRDALMNKFSAKPQVNAANRASRASRGGSSGGAKSRSGGPIQRGPWTFVPTKSRAAAAYSSAGVAPHLHVRLRGAQVPYRRR